MSKPRFTSKTGAFLGLLGLALASLACAGGSKGEAGPAEPAPASEPAPALVSQKAPAPTPPASAAQPAAPEAKKGAPEAGGDEPVKVTARLIGTSGSTDEGLVHALGKLDQAPDDRQGSGGGRALSGVGAPSNPQPTGRARPMPGKMKRGQANGDLGGWTKQEIDRGIRRRAGAFRACYARELATKPKLAGKVVVSFRITPAGKVKSARVLGAESTLRDKRVESCVTRQIMRIRFPAKDKAAEVRYPLVFTPK